MTFRYLDKDGALSFWTNIKNYILSKIPTKTSELTNDSGFLTQHQSLSNYVTLNSEQTITGKKLFTNSTTKVNSVNTFTGSTQFIDLSTTVPRGAWPAEDHRVGRVYIGDNTSYNGAWFIVDPTITSTKAYYRMVTTNPDNTDSTRFSIVWDSALEGVRRRKNVSQGDILPSANNTYNLGSSDLKWDIGYIHNLIGSNKENASEDANNYYSTTSGSHMTFYTTTNGGTKLSNVPAAVNTHLESRTIRYLSSSDWIVEQICHNSFGLYYRKGTNGTWEDWKTFAFTDSNITGTASNVTGTVAIANGGTGATTRLNAIKNLTNESVGSPTHFLGLTTNYAKCGYTSIAQAKTVLGITGDMGSHSDSEYVHMSGDETIGGNKTFSNSIAINGTYLGTEASGNERTNIYLLANRDTAGTSGAYIGRFRQNRTQGAMESSDVSYITFDFLENSTRYTRCFTMGMTDWDNDKVPQTYYLTSPDGKGSLGTATNVWNKVYANSYYLGTTSFTDKFVTTDTDQSISGSKIFNGDNIVITQGNGYRMVCNTDGGSSGYGVFQRVDGSSWYLMVTAQNDALGSWTSARPASMNLSTGVLSINGNAGTATQFSANKSVTLTGDVTGTASSKAGWSVATTLANSGVTAGTYGPSEDVTGNNNTTISVPQITVDAKGRVTSVTNRTLTCKNNTYNVYNKTLTIQKNGTNVATFTSNSNTNVTANITVPTKTSELTNDSNFLTTSSSLDASKLTGTIDIARLPQGALERVITVANQTARFALTTSSVQLGDTVKQLDTGVMYVVVNESKLNSNDGYLEYTAGSASSVPWSGITSKPTEFTPSSHTHTKSEITDFPTNVSAFTNDSGYLTSHQSLSNYVTLDGTQTIAGTKTFSSTISGSISGNAGTATQFSANTTVALTGDATGTSAGSKKGWSVPVTLANSGVTAGTYGPSADVTGNNNATILVPEITVDAKGRVTSVTNRTYTSVNTDNDKKVYQYYKSDDNVYRLLFSNNAGNTATSNVGAVYSGLNNSFYVNPSTGALYATKLYSNGVEVLTAHQSLDNYVTLDSNQTITAIKTITGGNQGKMIFKNPNFTLGTTPESTTTVTRIYFGGGASYDGSTGVITNDITSDGYSQLEICALNNNSSSSYRASLILRYEQDQTRPRFIKSWGDFCPYSDNTYYLGRSDSVWKECYCNAYYLGTTAFGDIVTHNASEFLTSHQSLSSCVMNVVTNNQTIKSTGITRGTAPSSAQTFGIGFSDNNNKYIGNIYGTFATDKSTYVGLYAYKGTTTSNGDNASVRVGYDASGNAYTYAPTPATTDNSTQIATTAFVKAQGYLTSHQSLANYVTTNTDQSISGIKSHSKHISILGDYIGNEFSTNARTCLYLKSNRDTDGKSGIYFSKFRQNVAQGALTGSNLVSLTLDVLENSVRTNNCISIDFRYFENDVPTKICVIPKKSATSYMGTLDNPWTNAYINNLILNGNAFDPTSIDGIGATRLLAYAPVSTTDLSNPAGTTKSGSSLYDVRMTLHNAVSDDGIFDSSSSGTFDVTIDKNRTQPGTWKVLHYISVGMPSVSHHSFAIAMWVRIA